MSSNLTKSIKEQNNLESMTVLDDKGFIIYTSQSQKQHCLQHNYYQLYQLGKYFYSQDDSQSPIILGIQTNSHITMIKGQKSADKSQKIVIIKQKLVDTVQINQNI